MATVKLTAQQKRDRQQAALIADMQRDWEIKTEKANNDHYAHGLSEGMYHRSYEFSRMSLWQRITYPRTFRKAL